MTLGRRAKIMGILNVTPDSFSDGGEYQNVAVAVTHALSMIADGADFIDIGGESTRPGADPITAKEELNRVVPVIEELRNAAPRTLISIDTMKAEVAARAIAGGASIINDVSGLQCDKEIAAVAAQHDVSLVLTHWDRERDTSRNIIGEITRHLGRAIEIAETAAAQGRVHCRPDGVLMRGKAILGAL